MNKLKNLLLNFPEVLLIAVTIFYWISSGTIVNPIAFGLIAVLIVQFFVRNDFLGVAIPILFVLASIFLLMALFSEFSELTVKNAESSRLLLVGVSYVLIVVTASGLMIRKYTR